MIVGGGGRETLTVNGSELADGAGALSVILTVKVNGPTLVGVPAREPSAPSATPGGGPPAEILQCSGRNPPVVLKVNGP
jgi:hypothetical protein